MFQLIWAFTKIFFRNPRAWFFVIFLPTGIFAIAALLSLESIIQADIKASYNDYLLIGILAMAVMQTGVYSVAYIMIDYRKSEIFKRLSITPLSAPRFLAAYTISRFLISCLQTIVLLSVGILAFGGHIQGFLWLLLLIFLGTAIFLNFGYIIAAISKDYEDAAPYTSTIGLTLVFLGDVFFPVKNLPWILQKIADYLPLKPLSSTLRHFAIGLPSADLAKDILVLFIWLFALTFVAQHIFSKKVYK